MNYTELILNGLIERRDEDDTIFATFRFDEGDPVFDGHFPNRPILAGVYQIEAVKALLEIKTGRRFRMEKTSSVKFHQPVLPGQEFSLSISIKVNDDKSVDIRCKSAINENNAKCAEIKARYVPDETP